MKFVATSVLIAVACFVVVAEAQKQPKIAPTQSPIKRPPFEPITGFEVVNPEPTPVTQTTLKPTTACSCGPTTLTSFTTSTLKPTNGTRPTSRPTNGTTSRPTSPTTTRQQIFDRTCSKFEANSETFYSNLCKPPGTHTLNLFSNSIWGAACQPSYPAASTVGSTDIATILKVHNVYRQRVAQGLETQGSPGPQPKASNMRELKWDNELACIAAAWARQCTYKHDQCRDVPRFRVGQNIFVVGSSTDTLGTSNWNSAITAWYNEVQFMNQSYVSSFPASPPNVIGHYTQVVWADTYLVGCATAYYQSTAVFGSRMPYNRIYVCNYGPTGNWIGSPVYAQGSPGSACLAGPSSSYTNLCA